MNQRAFNITFSTGIIQLFRVIANQLKILSHLSRMYEELH